MQEMQQDSNRFYFRSPTDELIINLNFINGIVHSQGRSQAINAIKQRITNKFDFLDDTRIFIDIDSEGVPIVAALGNVNG